MAKNKKTKGKWYLDKLGKKGFKVYLQGSNDYTKVVKTREEGIAYMNLVKQQIKESKYTQAERLENQPPGYPGSLQAKLDSAAVYKKVPEFTPGNAIVEADVGKIGKDIISVQSSIKELEHTIKKEPTSQNKAMLELLKQQEKDLFHSTGTIDTTGMSQPTVAPDEGGDSILSGIGSWISKGYNKSVWKQKREKELKAQFTANPDLVPEGQRKRLTMYIREQATKDWEQMQEDPSTISDEELRKRAGGSVSVKSGNAEFDKEYAMYKRDGGKLSKKEYMEYYGLQ